MKLTIEQLKKVNMATRISILLLLMQVLAASVVTAQSDLQSKFCENIEGTEIISAEEFISDSLYVTYSENASGLNLKIVNTTDQTVYLFSGYFPEIYHPSEYLHRISEKDKIYKVAFLPLLAYLSTKPTDKLILGSDRILSKGQVLYDFIKLTPQTYYKVSISYENLFKNLGERNSLICDYKDGENNKFDKIKFKYLSADKLKGKYKLFFEFAVYDQVNLLCEQSAYYLEESQFNQQAKSFRKISIPVKMNNYDHLIFN